MPAQGLLLVHAAATLFMTGLIWFVQVVHYPLFGRVGAEGFAAYEAAHSRLTTIVVMPVMLVEAAAALLLLYARPAGVPRALTWAGAALLALIWLSTWTLQVPMHAALSAGFDAAAHARLVWTNWIRTLAWTARGLLALWMILETRR